MVMALDKMSFEEKLKLMEELWAELVEHGDRIGSPLWHEKVLKERERRVRDGREPALDWDEAKEKIRQSTK